MSTVTYRDHSIQVGFTDQLDSVSFKLRKSISLEIRIIRNYLSILLYLKYMNVNRLSSVYNHRL